MLYQIILNYACFGIIVSEDDKIIDSAPIGRWMIGRDLKDVKRWINSKNGSIRVYSDYST